MNCSQCGAAAATGAAFCSQCGAPLNAGAAQQNPAAARVQPGSPRRDNIPEQDLWTGSYSPKAMTGAFVLAGLLTVIGIVAASFAGPIGWIVVAIAAVLLFAYLGLLLAYRRMSINYRLTSQRFLRDMGILSRRSDHLLVVNIDDVTVEQNFFDRMFNLGKIKLNVKDATTPVLTMLGIENPRHVADMIDHARRTERNRRGLYTMDA
jgi:membrane protein YdbS with pleckstrin-like domain